MSIGLTYDATLSRVRIAATSLPSAVDTVTFERSTNQVNWVTVRGGGAVTVSAGAASADDYEFTPGVANYYRITTVDTGPITYVGVGAASTANNASVSPALPVGWQAGDLALILASVRNSGTGGVGLPNGWHLAAVSSNVSLMSRRLQAGDTAPTVTVSAGVANADVIAQCAVFRNADTTVTSAQQLNASGQNIAYPARTIPTAGRLVVVAGWKQDDWTSVAALAGMTEIGETFSTAGDDAGQVWDYVVQTTATNIAAGSFTVTGGAPAISRGIVAAFTPAAYRTRETGSITPSIDRVWLKSIVRPFLNREVTVLDYSDVDRPSKAGVFEVAGRSYPVAVTDVRGSKRWTLDLLAADLDEAATLDLVLASGDPLFVQVPADCAVPGGYVSVGDITERRTARRSVRRIISLPCTEVVAPGADVVGATITCAGVLAMYATCSDVLLAHATCASLLELIGDPADVIVS